VRYCIYF